MSGNEWVHASAPYVRPRKPGEQDAWSEEAAKKGRRGTQRIVHALQVPAPAEVAAALGVVEGSAVIERRRTIYLDGEATELTNTYYPMAIAGGTRLAEPTKIPGGAVSLLAELGYIARIVREDVRARMPEESERTMLALAPGVPVLELIRRTADASAPFQVDVSVFPATIQRLRYEMKVG
ncbi:UTRA domain-containing protein [Streptomyces alkaliphilus]|uniref:UTRA domain-containing protein n=1 Tax=Streptomyces alkaliphilus TaxID=1472722 RepID=A0A7W3Y2C2_9ACTN|nr:UTRA domain-containing protein [Streptomyces alkaliphilus]MBB0245604.1 UTRA domain-containing protein [Streptomyces alkaliphilus]